jgi:polar amino acid transport system permease protein
MDQILENYFNAPVIAQALPEVFAGFIVTVEVAVCVIVIGVLTGLGLALLRCANNRPLNGLVTAYVEVFRTLPQLVIIIFIYFGLPYLGLTFSPFFATALALAAVLAAFSAGILTLRLVILPQSIRLAIPLITNRSIAITKGTALGAAVSLPEALGSAQSAMSIYANPSPLTLAAAFYLAFFIPLVFLSRVMEKRYAHAH